MSSRFSSALNYLSGGGASEGGSRFVGQTVDLGGGKKLKVKKVIAEGKQCTWFMEVTHCITTNVVAITMEKFKLPLPTLNPIVRFS